MTKVKFCGLRREEDADYVNLLRPDYAGFVLSPGFRRTIDAATARALRERIDGGITTVGVFVNAPAETVASFLNDGTIGIAQLHGDEGEDYIAELRKLTSGTLMKTFRVKGREDIARASGSPADLVMLDAGYGSGRSFDWSLVGSLGRRWFLAGGLDAGNVGDAIRLMRPYAVDVSSGVETEGCKDYDKMKAFARAVRSADAAEGNRNDESKRKVRRVRRAVHARDADERRQRT